MLILIFFPKLSNYVEQIDRLICLIAAVIYSTSIPSICLFLYCTFKASQPIELRKYVFMIVLCAYELIILSFLGILLHLKVRLISKKDDFYLNIAFKTRMFIPHLFKLDLNLDVFEKRSQIEKVRDGFLVSQMDYLYKFFYVS